MLRAPESCLKYFFWALLYLKWTKRYKKALKKYFDQLSSAHSTQKPVKIHNTDFHSLWITQSTWWYNKVILNLNSMFSSKIYLWTRQGLEKAIKSIFTHFLSLLIQGGREKNRPIKYRNATVFSFFVVLGKHKKIVK